MERPLYTNIMTAKQARVISKFLKCTCVICVIIGFISVLGAAGLSDFYIIELHQSVPGDQDTVLIKYGLIFFMVSAACGGMLEYIDFSIMYDIKSLPVRCTKSISREMKANKVFSSQVREALKRFYDGNWGDIDTIHIVDNNEAYERGEGVIVGLYKTMRGAMYIITNGDRTETDIIFESEY